MEIKYNEGKYRFKITLAHDEVRIKIPKVFKDSLEEEYWVKRCVKLHKDFKKSGIKACTLRGFLGINKSPLNRPVTLYNHRKIKQDIFAFGDKLHYRSTGRRLHYKD